MLDSIQWLGHGSFIIQGPPILYINPWRIATRSVLADFILIGHEHYDHFSPADIEKLRNTHTRIITSEAVAQLLPNATVLRPAHSISFDRCRITAVPAYSLSNDRHPRERGDIGFLISLNFYDIYYAGDTERTPEMERLRPDIAILPIDGDGTLTIESAVEVVQMLRPRWVYPANWGETSKRAGYPEALEFQRRVQQATNQQVKVLLPKDQTARVF